MNVIIAMMEFVVLVLSIGLLSAEINDTTGEWHLNWKLPLLGAAFFMIALNASFICTGITNFLHCKWSCGDKSPEITEAEEAVAAYRRVKKGLDEKPGFFERGESVDIKHLDQDSAEKLLFRNLKPKDIAKQANAKVNEMLAAKVTAETRATEAQILANAKLAKEITEEPSKPEPSKVVKAVEPSKPSTEEPSKAAVTRPAFNVKLDAQLKAARTLRRSDNDNDVPLGRKPKQD